MSIYDEVKAEFGEGPRFAPRSDFSLIHGYTQGRSLGAFPTVAEAKAAGATATEKVCDEEAFKVARDAYNAHQGALMDEWKSRVRAAHPEVNDAVFEIVYAKAHEDGHSGGMGEVEIHIDAYVDFATQIIGAARS